MLVIRRRAGESLTIGGGIEIRVLETTPQRVTIGIVAPPDVLILRNEIREQNREAAGSIRAPIAPQLAARLACLGPAAEI